jgi:hypothetical protein
MSESKQRPVGVTALGILHIVCGSAGIVAVIAGFLMRPAQEEERSGIPLELLLGITLFAFLGFGVGSALLKGRPWAWYVASFAYVLAAVTSAFAVPALIEWVQILEPLSDFIPAITVAKVAVAALLAVYMFMGGAGDFFGVGRRTRWVLLLLEVGVSVGLFFGVRAFVNQWSIEPKHEDILLLQNLGERRASAEDDIRFMLDRLENGVMEERASAAWALGQSGRGDVLPQLLEASRDDSDVSVRINAIVAVAELGGKEIQADLVGFLADRDFEIQRAALRGLADKRFAGAAETIGQFMLDNEPLRGIAADVLGNMGNVAALPVLQQTATDPQEDVRSRVAHALGKLGDRRAVPTLIEMLDDQRWPVRANAAQSLGMIGDPGARPSLEKARNDPNTQVRAEVEAALQRLP